ncbi:hypothetical protein TNCV_2781281 [Trichonephila clavipes]|nr:hypothetical protein TNCV_2781281 [Trichonephila clavipes]
MPSQLVHGKTPYWIHQPQYLQIFKKTNVQSDRRAYHDGLQPTKEWMTTDTCAVHRITSRPETKSVCVVTTSRHNKFLRLLHRKEIQRGDRVAAVASDYGHELMAGISRLNEIGNGNEEVVHLASRKNLQVDSNDVQELLDSFQQELTMDELPELHEQDIE